MTRIRYLLAILLAAALTGDASAQFFPPPIFFVPTISQPGIGFTYGSNHLNIAGFFGSGPPSLLLIPVRPTPFGPMQVGPTFVPYGSYSYPYGARNPSITVQVITPTVIVRDRRSSAPDLTGIDLDVESPAKIWGERPVVAKAKIPREADLAKAEVPKVKMPEPEVPAKKVPPRVLPLDGDGLADLGTQAFLAGEFGVALLRFRQSGDADAPAGRALFLQGHAMIAVGKYQEAAEAIQKGLQARPNFPGSGFRPRVEIYGNNNDLWKEHVGRLEAAQKLQPKNADLLFLLGYLAWFDGQGDAAVAYFQQSRAFAVDPRFCDAFLKMK